MNNRRRGKRTEKKVAELMGGKRIGVMGGEDIQHPVFSIEVKNRVRWIGTSFMAQAQKHCPVGRLPLVRVHVHGSRYEDDLIIMRSRDLLTVQGYMSW